ncbi:MAG: hypothetical protein B1H09_02890 [Gemmatimonadaceae bacterium 4484_173]|nr:MAG: hypothetical protein B1H09_02890 [Gemmatimonadaceae bacterium 4484_173]
MADQEALLEEINQYKREKESVRKILGQIGGAGDARKEKITGIAFASLVILLFSFDFMRHALHLNIDFIPEMFSVEIAVLLVSIKILWMVHRQQKVEHFQFWILNTIEYQMNSTAVKIRRIEKTLEEFTNQNPPEK